MTEKEIEILKGKLKDHKDCWIVIDAFKNHHDLETVKRLCIEEMERIGKPLKKG